VPRPAEKVSPPGPDLPVPDSPAIATP
jgi:hypothetical protein